MMSVLYGIHWAEQFMNYSRSYTELITENFGKLVCLGGYSLDLVRAVVEEHNNHITVLRPHPFMSKFEFRGDQIIRKFSKRDPFPWSLRQDVLVLLDMSRAKTLHDLKRQLVERYPDLDAVKCDWRAICKEC